MMDPRKPPHGKTMSGSRSPDPQWSLSRRVSGRYGNDLEILKKKQYCTVQDLFQRTISAVPLKCSFIRISH